ncbi:MAG: SAM-dependent methyltransferase, partial [Gammaproteobacteria bacterium]|nr:SAM-dependent methyltransferase [Gammaproteobacteria bacterium]
MTMSLTEISVFDNLSWFERLCRKFALDFISQLQHGDITVVEGNQRLRFGDEHASLKTVITVVDPAFYQKMVMAGSVGGGEAYINGWW